MSRRKFPSRRGRSQAKINAAAEQIAKEATPQQVDVEPQPEQVRTTESTTTTKTTAKKAAKKEAGSS